MYKLCFFVPDSHLEEVKQALFAVGAGRIGHYDSCCWQVLGQGQFRPLPGSQPHIGAQMQLEILPEWKVEMVLSPEVARQAVETLKSSHPYEEIAYELSALIDPDLL
ncbi:NGG1p interacting factor NIF3 [Nitrincola tapanii]|uniref:NGG1p interacting factor NIF3 n=1 Tax=Nitrincola tapanii TaxID=1708751 RepID=A0A5A9W7P1_9GAMM|nr:NGG1p interacting factor NIF3 [Nitrincola tapanii]KAA0876484.1 NGG1p interacting factor NIF3 [Nitrincola tapanii]